MTARRAGFSLIEAMAALLIVSLVLLAALSLQGQMAQAERRYERAITVSELRRTAMVLVRDVNPAVEPVGTRPLAGGRRLAWSAVPVDAFQPSTDGRFEVRLYRVTTTLFEPDGRVLSAQTYQRVGWRPRQRGAAAGTASTRRP